MLDLLGGIGQIDTGRSRACRYLSVTVSYLLGGIGQAVVVEQQRLQRGVGPQALGDGLAALVL